MVEDVSVTTTAPSTAGPAICHSVTVRVVGDGLRFCSPAVDGMAGGTGATGPCPACGGLHMPLDAAMGLESAEVFAQAARHFGASWSEVALEEGAQDVSMGCTPPLRLCATPLGMLPAEAASRTACLELELKVVADPLDLAQRARFSIYPPWRLGPDTRFSWRMEPRGPQEEAPPGAGAWDKQLPFQVLSNAADPEAETPAGFRLPLHQHQLKSLAWMISCEDSGRAPLLLGARREFLPVLHPPHRIQSALVAALACKAMARVQRAYHVRGGLLADQVGSGKTATVLALLASAAATQVGRTAEASVRPSLVLAPSRLLVQWRNEVYKFLGSERLEVAVLRSLAELRQREEEGSRCCCAGGLLLLLPFELFGQEAGDAAAAGPERQKRRRGGGCLVVSAPGQQQQLSAVVELLRARRFARVVVDEFHEALRPEWRALREALPHIQAEATWALSGTPPVGSFAAVAQVAEAFGVGLGVFRHQLDAHSLAQRALDHLARSNTSKELEGLTVHEEILPLHHTPAEKTIYMQTRMNSEAMRNGDSPRDKEAALLQLCSHFQLDQGDAKDWEDAEGECAHALREREAAMETAKEGLRAAAWRMEAAAAAARGPRAAGGGGAAGGRASPLLVAEQYGQLLAEVGFAEEPGGGLAEQVLGARAAGAASAGHRHELEADALIREALLAARQDARVRGPEACAASATLEMFEEVRQAKEAFKQRAHEHAFLSAMLKSADAEAFACPICFAETEPQQRAILAACAHLFCLACATRLAQRARECALCRQVLRGDSEVLRIREPGTVALGDRGDRQRWGRFGSKLFHVVRKLREIEQGDPTARAIVFVQWTSLRAKLASAFTEFGVPFLSLEQPCAATATQDRGGAQGGALAELAAARSPSFWERDDIITTFQGAPKDCTSGPKVLLLSLQDAASGLNLTRANHVLFVHPMSASSQRVAVAYEMQALGRCVRLGQEKTVFLWRFVTLGTVEEELSLRHQEDLWRRRPELWSARRPPRQGVASMPSRSAGLGEVEEEDTDDLFW